MTSNDLYNKRFVLFSGKGGVGKTTMASAFAWSCARRGERTLLMELNVKDKAGSLFETDGIDTEIREIRDNLYAVNVSPKAAMREYALMILKIKLVYRAVFENRVVSSFLKVIPGLNELVMLGKAYYHVKETDAEGAPVWDKVVVDAPATGHGIFLLKIPMVITNLISSGLMFEEARQILELLQDPERTALALVTLAEEMPVNETLMLSDVVRDEMGLHVACVLANGIYSDLFSDDEVAWMDEHLRGGDAEVQGLVEAARFRRDRATMQREYLQKLRDEGPWPVREIPFLFFERMAFPIVDELAGVLEQLFAVDETASRSVG